MLLLDAYVLRALATRSAAESTPTVPRAGVTLLPAGAAGTRWMVDEVVMAAFSTN